MAATNSHRCSGTAGEGKPQATGHVAGGGQASTPDTPAAASTSCARLCTAGDGYPSRCTERTTSRKPQVRSKICPQVWVKGLGTANDPSWRLGRLAHVVALPIARLGVVITLSHYNSSPNSQLANYTVAIAMVTLRAHSFERLQYT